MLRRLSKRLGIGGGKKTFDLSSEVNKMTQEQQGSDSIGSMLSSLGDETKSEEDCLAFPTAFDWSQNLPTCRTKTWRSGKDCDSEGITDDPSNAWATLRGMGMPYAEIPSTVSLNPLPPKEDGFLRVVCISDTHGREGLIPRDFIPDGDILIHAGDFTNTGEPEQVEKFAEWFASFPHRHKVLIAGNHDLTLHPEFYSENYKRFKHFAPYETAPLLELLRGHQGFVFLEDESVVIENYVLYGSPWQPTFYNWAFNLERGAAIRKYWKQIPSNTEILITHGPPLGYGDLVKDITTRAGCLDLLREVQTRIQPLHHIFGHIHESHGSSTDGVTQYHNASTCTTSYRPDQAALFFDIPVKNPEYDLL